MKSKLVIGITGVHGSGKSTLAHTIADEIRDTGRTVGVGDEVARDCPYPIALNTTRQAQDWIFDTHKCMEDEYLAGDWDVIIFDRLLMDNVLYTLHLIASGRGGGMDNSVCRQFGHALERMPLYDLVIRLQYNPGLCIDDEKRSSDPFFACQIEELFDTFVAHHVHATVHDVRKTNIMARTIAFVEENYARA